MNATQHQPGLFWRLDQPTIERVLVHEGWQPALVNDPPGQVYPIHQHPTTKLIAVVHGSMEVKVGVSTYRCLPGDKLVIPGYQEHAALVGPEGCSFFWSEAMLDTQMAAAE